eukprot:CAMPEP_0171750294 /NCGR_PEP_ID=MMETSP0991-20121206/41305_1 /TAXON_ID=483369 /ORGANISM="non described non described, Strain CCMP2098" /LENGTH=63 /DNA_ID=CAMNT_0012351199 /DNA_START=195 /DNA_END=386 /DNA_ORIENTATION=-
MSVAAPVATLIAPLVATRNTRAVDIDTVDAIGATAGDPAATVDGAAASTAASSDTKRSTDCCL